MADQTDPEILKNTKAPRQKKKVEKDPEVGAETAEVEEETGEVLKQVQLQKDLVDQLKAAKNAEARVRTFAKIMDTYGLEAIISLFPEAGDALTSVLSGLYLLYEADKAGLSKTDYIKIVGLQTADFFVGAIPVIGDVADFFFKASKMSIPLFKDRVDELVIEARKAGVSEDAIAKITESADKLPRVVDHAVEIHKILKKAAA